MLGDITEAVIPVVHDTFEEQVGVADCLNSRMVGTFRSLMERDWAFLLTRLFSFIARMEVVLRVAGALGLPLFAGATASNPLSGLWRRGN